MCVMAEFNLAESAQEDDRTILTNAMASKRSSIKACSASLT
jgi:hypothetical protein